MKGSLRYIQTMLAILCIALTLQIILRQKEYTEMLEADVNFLIEEVAISSQRAAESSLRVAELEAQVNIEEDIYEIASRIYGVDIHLLKAIERLESGNYTSEWYLTRNNTWGCRRNGEWATFDSPEHSTMELARTLRHSYIDNGMVTPSEMAETFCPDSPEEWASVINTLFWEEIEKSGSSADYGPGQ